MKIYLDDSDAPVLVFRGGALVGEIIGGHLSKEDNLLDRVRSAHCLMAARRALQQIQSAPPESLTCHKVTNVKKAKEDLGRGFVDGLDGATSELGCPPEHTKAYRAGYDAGATCRSAIGKGGDI